MRGLFIFQVSAVILKSWVLLTELSLSDNASEDIVWNESIERDTSIHEPEAEKHTCEARMKKDFGTNMVAYLPTSNSTVTS